MDSNRDLTSLPYSPDVCKHKCVGNKLRRWEVHPLYPDKVRLRNSPGRAQNTTRQQINGCMAYSLLQVNVGLLELLLAKKLLVPWNLKSSRKFTTGPVQSTSHHVFTSNSLVADPKG
jgi:hypothetical protein